MIQRVLEDVVAEAVNHAPSLIILDNLDGLIPCGLESPEPATTVVALAKFLGDVLAKEVLVDRAVHVAATGFLSFSSAANILSFAATSSLATEMDGIAKGGTQVGRSGWEDVGALTETCRALQEVLETPIKHGELFARAPLRLRSSVLLYSPPGCGKTHIEVVTTAACSLHFVSVKGPELLNKYIGAFEQGLLTELDGMEALTGVFVFTATSQPDLLDVALLRPGRLDRMLLCDFPSMSEPCEILQVLSQKVEIFRSLQLLLDLMRTCRRISTSCLV
ncbi:unnamed protein product [Sphagnum troendelagicum]|uniref:ATPase AAA-type core domain-containing protein n=1 Tax=Sphagnum troendelagicum TaxID=128251 RepID=A0ABP0UVI8_9BRYO